MFASQVMPNLSASWPKVSPHGTLARGIVTLPPAESLLKNPYSAGSDACAKLMTRSQTAIAAAACSLEYTSYGDPPGSPFGYRVGM